MPLNRISAAVLPNSKAGCVMVLKGGLRMGAVSSVCVVCVCGVCVCVVCVWCVCVVCVVFDVACYVGLLGG